MRCSIPAAAMAVVGTASVAVVVAVWSSTIAMGAAKAVVTVTAEAAPMAPLLIKCAP